MFVFLLSSGNLTCLPWAVVASILHFFSLSVLLQVLLFKRERRGKKYVWGGGCTGREVFSDFGSFSLWPS